MINNEQLLSAIMGLRREVESLKELIVSMQNISCTDAIVDWPHPDGHVTITTQSRHTPERPAYTTVEDG